MKWHLQLDEVRLNSERRETTGALGVPRLDVQGEAKQSRYILVLWMLDTASCLAPALPTTSFLTPHSSLLTHGSFLTFHSSPLALRSPILILASTRTVVATRPRAQQFAILVYTTRRPTATPILDHGHRLTSHHRHPHHLKPVSTHTTQAK